MKKFKQKAKKTEGAPGEKKEEEKEDQVEKFE
jgi:hypothetical protein